MKGKDKVERISVEEFNKYLKGFADTLTRMHAEVSTMQEAQPVRLPAVRTIKALAVRMRRVEDLVARMKHVTTTVKKVSRRLTPEEIHARKIARARAFLESEGLL